jgi:uncharacterized repeat protein (TIGR01451 family)
VNNTSSDGKTHVNDRLTYTITVRNDGLAKTNWVNVVITDVIPDGLILDTNSIRNGQGLYYNYNASTRTLTVSLGNIPGQTQRVVNFDATVAPDAFGKNIKNSVSVAGKENTTTGPDVTKDADEEDGDRIVTGKSAVPTINPITAGAGTISGTGVPGAAIEVTLPDGTKLSATVDNNGNWTVTVPAGKEPGYGTTVKAIQTEPGKDPSDEVSATVGIRPDPVKEVSKTSANLANRADKSWRVGDTSEYTVTVKNNGSLNSLWENVIIEDTLPTQVTFLTSFAVTINGSAAGAAASFSNGTLTVDLGSIAGQVTKVVVFRTQINETAYGQKFKNTLSVDNITVEDPGPDDPVLDRSAKPTIDEINDGDRNISGTGIAGSIISVYFPGVTNPVTATVGQDNKWTVSVPQSVNLVEGNIVKATQTQTGLDASEPVEAEVQGKKEVIPTLTKVSENLSRTDNSTHVGDRLKYTITLGNTGSTKSIWTSAEFVDKIPDGVTLVQNSVRLDNAIPTYSFYDEITKTLRVTIATKNTDGTVNEGIKGGQERVVTFEVTVDADAFGKVVKNAASVTGKGNTPTGPDINKDTEEDGPGRTITDKSKPPTVDEITRGDDTVTGTGVPGATITVTLPDGSTATGTVDSNGDWTVDLPSGTNLKTGDQVKVVQTELNKDPSDPVTVTVKDKTTRAVHGYVWPMLVNTLDLTEETVRKHDIIIELRPTFLSPATLSTVAVLLPNNTEGKGEFTFEKVPFGTYVLYIERPGHLPRAMMVTIAPTDPDLIELTPPATANPYEPDEGVFRLWWGDCNGDGLVDNLDFMMIEEYMANGITNATHPLYSAACDMSGDGLIDNLDYMMVQGHWGRSWTEYPGMDKVNIDE